MTTNPPSPGLFHIGGDAYVHPDLTGTLRHIEAEVGSTALTPYPGNPRRGDQEAITSSIRELGLYRAIIVQRSTGHVLAGNHTLRALRDLGATHAPVTWVDVDDTRAAAIVARDNRTSDLGQYDEEALLALLTTDEDVAALSGYDAEDVAALAESLSGPLHTADTLAGTEDNYEEKYGVIVMCGSAAEQETVYDRLTDEGLTVRVVTV